MKFNWGTGIALFYGTFVLLMIGVVFASRQHNPGLVQKNYYDLDLNYQARLEKKQNAAGLTEQPRAQFNASEKTVSLHFPAGMIVAGGTAKLYRSSTTDDDFFVKIENTNAVEIPAGNLASGRWHVELDWEAGGKTYFWETTVRII